MGLHSAVSVGEGGDVVLPGLGDARLLASETRVHAVPGLELVVGDESHAIPDGGVELAPGEWVKLRVAAHPEIELVVGRERIEPVPISRLPIPPWREAAYGVAFAACMASLISVKVAASPVRQREQQDRELAQELLVDVPIAFALPPPLLAESPAEPDAKPTEATAPVVDDGEVDVAEVSEVAQLDPAAKPKPRKRRAPRRTEEGVAMILGVAGGTGELVNVLDSVGSDASPFAAALTSADAVLPTIVVGETAEPAAEDVPGVAATPSCELEYDAKDRIDIVLVVDASAPMAKVLANLADRVPELHRTLADKQVRYGLVAFADQVELTRLDSLTKDEVRVALLELSRQAQDREPDADVRDDVLGALDRAHEFSWGARRDTLRMMVLVTDNDFGDRGERLGEHEVKPSYARVVDELADDSIRVTTVTRRKVPGLDDGRGDHPSLPAATGGIALRESTLYPTDGLADAMRDLLRNPVCRKNIVDVLVE